MPTRRILYVEDDPQWQEDTKTDVEQFFRGSEVIVATDLESGIRCFRENVGRLFASILDNQLSEQLDGPTSMDLFRIMTDVDSDFASKRVTLYTTDSEQVIRPLYRVKKIPFPSRVIPKAHTIDLVRWLKSLPDIETP